MSPGEVNTIGAFAVFYFFAAGVAMVLRFPWRGDDDLERLWKLKREIRKSRRNIEGICRRFYFTRRKHSLISGIKIHIWNCFYHCGYRQNIN
jgi:hypothetical protein